MLCLWEFITAHKRRRGGEWEQFLLLCIYIKKKIYLKQVLKKCGTDFFGPCVVFLNIFQFVFMNLRNASRGIDG